MASSVGLHPIVYITYAVGANGVSSIALGIAALTNPLLFSRMFDLQAKSPEARKVAKDLLAVYASRDLILGLGLTSAAYHSHRETMGWLMVGIAIVIFRDGLVSKSNVEGGQWKHWSFVEPSLGLSAACFGYI